MWWPAIFASSVFGLDRRVPAFAEVPAGAFSCTGTPQPIPALSGSVKDPAGASISWTQRGCPTPPPWRAAELKTRATAPRAHRTPTARQPATAAEQNPFSWSPCTAGRPCLLELERLAGDRPQPRGNRCRCANPSDASEEDRSRLRKAGGSGAHDVRQLPGRPCPIRPSEQRPTRPSPYRWPPHAVRQVADHFSEKSLLRP